MATDAIRTAYHEGRGSIPMRGKVIIEGDPKADGNGNGGDGTAVVKAGKAGRGKTQRKRSGEGKPAVVITELPYQINKVCNLNHVVHFTIGIAGLSAPTLQHVSPPLLVNVTQWSDRCVPQQEKSWQ